MSNGDAGGSDTMAVSFKGAHFPQDIILMGVRWYVAYPLSYRHVGELLEEHGVPIDHATIQPISKHYPQRRGTRPRSVTLPGCDSNFCSALVCQNKGIHTQTQR